MDRELRRYLTAILVLLSLTVGLLVTWLWASAEALSLTFLVIPPTVVACVVGLGAWVLAGALVPRSTD